MNRPGPAVLALGALLLLASCSGDDADANPSPSPSASATTASPTPTEPPPTMPAQAREDSNEGAAAFVAHYFEVFTYAARTQDTTPLRALSAEDCTGCNEYIQLFESNRIPALDWSTKDLQVTSDETDYGLRVKVDAVEEKGPAVYDLYLQFNKASRKITVLEQAQ